jgi:succinyl-diaminopimelate desuccinylase
MIFGDQGHVAYPHRGNNPSTIIVKILNELKNIKFDKGNKRFSTNKFRGNKNKYK